MHNSRLRGQEAAIYQQQRIQQSRINFRKGPQPKAYVLIDTDGFMRSKSYGYNDVYDYLHFLVRRFGTAYPSVQRIANKTGLSERQVQRILREMEEDGILVTRYNPCATSNYLTANLYVLSTQFLSSKPLINNTSNSFDMKNVTQVNNIYGIIDRNNSLKGKVELKSWDSLQDREQFEKCIQLLKSIEENPEAFDPETKRIIFQRHNDLFNKYQNRSISKLEFHFNSQYNRIPPSPLKNQGKL